jgi:transcriptional regulator with XRE-family HTH domain
MHVSKINILLTALGITHEQIAKATGLSQSMVTMTIKGERTSRKTQDRITSYLRDQITVGSLFGIETKFIDTTSSLQAKGSMRPKQAR